MFYDKLFLKYMLMAEVLLLSSTYLTLFLYNYLIPKKRILVFFVGGFFTWNAYTLLDAFLRKEVLKSISYIAKYEKIDIYLDNFSYYMLFYFFIVLLKYFKQNYIFQYNQNQISQQRMLFELENLKAQISPHFLFNTMNNFYGLAVDNSNKLPNLMIRLSDLLRYSLYETKNNKVPLDNEIKYLENYIELEKIRLEDDLNISFVLNNKSTTHFQIAPLLLITFLENAFKHSKNIQKEPIIIDVLIEISETGILTFMIKNNFDSNSNNNLTDKKGIGLENVKKRLEVIYPNSNHTLLINNQDNFFNVVLTINLN